MKFSSSEEQELCVSCGFCCDRTLFDIAKVYDDDELLGSFKENETEIDGQRYFKLPCECFNQKCTIYDKPKPKICSVFICNLLHKGKDGEISLEEALPIVANAKKLRDELIEEYEELMGVRKTFREIFVQSFKDKSFDTDPAKKIIKYKAHLLDILISKEFKSKESFDMFYEMSEE